MMNLHRVRVEGAQFVSLSLSNGDKPTIIHKMSEDSGLACLMVCIIGHFAHKAVRRLVRAFFGPSLCDIYVCDPCHDDPKLININIIVYTRIYRYLNKYLL